jgi:hypothetical protein
MEYLKKTSRKYSELDEIDSLISPLLISFNKKVDELI